MNLSRFKGGLSGRLMIVVGVPMLFAIGAGVAVFFALRYAVSAEAAVRESDHRLEISQRLLLHVVDADANERGLALTGQQVYSSGFDEARAGWKEAVAALRTSFATSPDQLARVDRMDSLFTTWLAEVADPVVQGRREQPPSHLEAVQAMRSALFSLLEIEEASEIQPHVSVADRQRESLEQMRSQIEAARGSIRDPHLAALWQEVSTRLETFERLTSTHAPHSQQHDALRALLRQTNLAAGASRAREKALLHPITSGAGRELVDWIRKIEGELVQVERQRLEGLLGAKVARGRIAGWLAVACLALALAFGFAAAQALARRLRSSLRTVGRAAERLAAGDLRQRVEETGGEDLGLLARSFNQLADRVSVRDREVTILQDMGQLLQAANDPEEACQIVGRILPALVPGASGALYTPNLEGGELVRRTEFGEPHRGGAVKLEPGACWGLRKGQTYLVLDPAAGLVCSHLSAPAWPYICMPLSAQGQSLGMLHLETPPGDRGARLSAVLGLLPAVASEIALSLSNLSLRAELLARSVRDPLTGLFNRRYLEETLTREVDRARRRKTALTVAMTDLDHFKRLNDTWGHEAGDQVLKLFADLLRAHFRTQDVLCRYGGEEFALIFPDCSTDQALSRAASLLAALRASRLAYGEDAIGGITASMGIAGYPRQGASPEALLRQADHALYEAKRAGRDRVHVAPEAKTTAFGDDTGSF